MTSRVCRRDGLQLFALTSDEPTPHYLRKSSARVDVWRCTVCGGFGDMPEFAR